MPKPRLYKPRLYLHPEGKIVSIGFEGTNDTLLSLEFGAAVYGDKDRDRGDMLVLREWVEAVSKLLNPEEELWLESRVRIMVEEAFERDSEGIGFSPSYRDSLVDDIFRYGRLGH